MECNFRHDFISLCWALGHHYLRGMGQEGRLKQAGSVGSTYFVVFVRDQPDISLVYIVVAKVTKLGRFELSSIYSNTEYVLFGKTNQ